MVLLTAVGAALSVPLAEAPLAEACIFRHCATACSLEEQSFLQPSVIDQALISPLLIHQRHRAAG